MMKTESAPATLEPIQLAELQRLKSYFPYRIVWGMIDKETGAWEAIASQTKRHLNKAIRDGHAIFTLQAL